MKLATSDLVLTKASIVQPIYVGAGVFVVPSGSTIGQAYKARFLGGILSDFGAWSCDCPWAEHGGQGCAHVRSALAMAEAGRKAAA